MDENERMAVVVGFVLAILLCAFPPQYSHSPGRSISGVGTFPSSTNFVGHQPIWASGGARRVDLERLAVELAGVGAFVGLWIFILRSRRPETKDDPG